MLSGARAGAAAEGIDAAAQRHEPASFLKHVASLTLNKAADGLFDPKLVLSWLLTHLGAPGFVVGLLVPIREAGALLPQLFAAPRIHRLAQRKWAWSFAALVQGVSALAIAVVALGMKGVRAGIATCAAVAMLAVARAVASVSYKDVLGKTVAKSRRGAATGLAASASAAVVVVFAITLMAAPLERYVLVLYAISIAGAFWLASAAVFATLFESQQPGESEDGVFAQLRLLREAPDLRRFIAARGLLTGTALAPPYLVLLGAEADGGVFEALGASVLASAAASFLSSYVWGRLSDRSSRLVLAASGGFGALALGLAIVFDWLGHSGSSWAIPLSLFVLMICYHGVRQGRSTYLVDLAPADQRLSYTAVANTVIGVLLLGSGAIGAVASLVGPRFTLAAFALMALAGGIVALSAKEVSRRV